MSLKGGYKILDLSVNPSYDEIAKVLNTEKAVLVSGLIVEGVKQKDCFASVEVSDGVYTLKTPDRVITIDSTNEVKVTEGILLDSLVDKEGNHRFIEGEGTNGDSLPDGVSISYNKWSLSGTHLMFVIAGTVANTTELANSLLFASFVIPQWIYNKIFAVWGGSNIERKAVLFTADDFTTQNPSIVLAKAINNTITVRHVGTTTLTADRGFRIQFDLLIDTD